MVGGIAGVGGLFGVNFYGVSGVSRAYGAGVGTGVMRSGRAAPEAPVQPVKAVPTPTAGEAQPTVYSSRLPSEFSSYAMPVLPQSYGAELANRARVEYPQGQPAAQQGAQAAAQQGAAQSPETAGPQLPSWPGTDAAETLVRMRIQYPGQGAEDAQALENQETGAAAAQEALEEGKCETCEQRKYQDGSDDVSVSYQSPTRIDPDMAASAVRGHEMEHVAHEQARAQREDRKVVSQSVTLHTDICPECGKSYISGGTTRTVTKANPQEPAQQPQEEEPEQAA